MKSNYSTPTVTLRGDAVLYTKGSNGGIEDGVHGPLAAPGSVGFNL